MEIDPLFMALVLLVIALGVIGIVISYNLGKKKKKGIIDKGNEAAAEHPFAKNPIIIAFVVFGLGMALIIYLISLFFY